MKWGEFFGVSLTSLRANRVRSLLTMLGIIIGVGAVIVMISLGQGAKKAVSDRLEALGTNLLYIRSGQPHTGGVHIEEGSFARLDERDLRRLKAEITACDVITPEVRGNKQIIYGNKNWNTSVVGTGPDYLRIRNYTLADGVDFTEQDVNSIGRVAIIGPTVAENLFGKSSPIGKTIRIGRIRFDVIGVTQAKGASGGWQDFDDMILIPYTTAQKRVYGKDYIDRFVAHLKDETLTNTAYVEIEKTLRQSHRLRPDEQNLATMRLDPGTVGELLARAVGISARSVTGPVLSDPDAHRPPSWRTCGALAHHALAITGQNPLGIDWDGELGVTTGE